MRLLEAILYKEREFNTEVAESTESTAFRTAKRPYVRNAYRENLHGAGRRISRIDTKNGRS